MENFKADKFCVLSLLSVLFSIFQKISIKRCQAPAAPVLTQALNVPYIFYTGYSYILMYMLVFEFEFQNSIMSRLVTCPSTLAPIWIPFKSLIGVQMTVFFGFQLSSLHGFQNPSLHGFQILLCLDFSILIWIKKVFFMDFILLCLDFKSLLG